MNVGVDKPGDNRLACEVDDLRNLGDLNLATFTNGNNPLALNNYNTISDWRETSSIE